MEGLGAWLPFVVSCPVFVSTPRFFVIGCLRSCILDLFQHKAFLVFMYNLHEHPSFIRKCTGASVSYPRVSWASRDCRSPPVPRASCLLVPGRPPDLAAGAKLGQSQERVKAAPKGPRFPLIKRLFSRAARPSSRSIPLPFRPRQSEAEQIFPADACRSDRRGNNWQLRPRDQGDTD